MPLWKTPKNRHFRAKIGFGDFYRKESPVKYLLLDMPIKITVQTMTAQKWKALLPNGKHKLFFSNDLTLTGEEVLKCYRSRFQIEFCFRDAKQFSGLCDCQAREPWKLDYAFNASFTSLNVAKVMMKEIGMDYSMASFKSLMFNTYLTKRIFKTSGYRPNRTLISKIFKDLFSLQRKAAWHIIEFLTDYCYNK